MSRLADIYKAQKEKNQSVLGAFGSTITERAKEKFDPRQLIDQRGILASMFPMLRTYRSKTDRETRRERADRSTSATPLQSTENVVQQALIDQLRAVTINTQITAKNTLSLPAMARDMNVMRQGIVKLVKLAGGEQRNKADAFFKSSKEEEATYENLFNKKSSEKISDKKKDKQGSLLASLASLIAGIADLKGVIGSLLTNLPKLLLGLGKNVSSLVMNLVRFVPAMVAGLTGMMPAILAFLTSPTGLAALAAILGTLAIKKIIDDVKVGEQRKQDLSTLRQKKESGETLTEDEENQLGELERAGVTESSGESQNRGLRSHINLETSKQVLQSLTDEEIKRDYGVSRKVMQEFYDRNSNKEDKRKKDIFSIADELNETVDVPRPTTNARRTGDKRYIPDQNRAETLRLQRQDETLRLQRQEPTPPAVTATPPSTISRPETVSEISRKVIDGSDTSFKTTSESKVTQYTNNASTSLIQNTTTGNNQTSYVTKVGMSESAGKYDTVFGKSGGAKINDKPVTENTIAEVIEWQNSMKGTNRQAVGKYQFMDLAGVVKNTTINVNEKFSPAVQEMLMQSYTNNNAKILNNLGIPSTDANLHLAHTIGPGGVKKIYDAKNKGLGNVPVADILNFKPGSSARKTNPHLEATVDQYITQIASKHDDKNAPTVMAQQTTTNAPTSLTQQTTTNAPTTTVASSQQYSPTSTQSNVLSSTTIRPQNITPPIAPIQQVAQVSPEPQLGSRLSQMNSELTTARENIQTARSEQQPPIIIKQDSGKSNQGQLSSPSMAAPASVYDRDVVDSLFKRQGPSYSLT